MALPVALQGPASVLLSLWRVGQRERGPRSPRAGAWWNQAGWVGASIPGLLTAHHMKECRSPGTAKGADATPPAPTAGMWLASDKAGREGDLSRLATG